MRRHTHVVERADLLDDAVQAHAVGGADVAVRGQHRVADQDVGMDVRVGRGAGRLRPRRVVLARHPGNLSRHLLT